jgi:hypothetical protein
MKNTSLQDALSTSPLARALLKGPVTLDNCFEQFERETPEFYQYFSDKAVRAMFTLAEYKMKETSNPPSISLFTHCFDELKQAGLQKLRGPLPKPEDEPKDESNMTAEEFLKLYRSLSTSETKSRYSRSADFKRQVNRLSELGWI